MICEFLQGQVMISGPLSLILLLHIQGSTTLDSFSVRCSKQNICGVRGSQVTLTCSYPSNNFKSAFWFNKNQSKNWRHKDEPEDVSLDLDFSGRVDQRITGYQSDLTIRDVRERDSGEYQLMFLIKDGVKHISSVSVNLTVTVLQVRIDPESTNQVKLICDSSCELTLGSYYSWYTNGHKYSNYYNKNLIVTSSGYTDRYSCSKSRENNPSPSVCLSNSSCWDVTYPSRRVCALVGSTVDVQSSYSHPNGYTVVNTYWHLRYFKFKDLREGQQFAGRVEYVKNMLRIKDVKMSDSGEYQFRIFTNSSLGKYSGSPGVILTVTDTRVKSSRDPAGGGKVILSCLTNCSLDNKHTYIWYKNGTQVTDGFTLLHKLYLDTFNYKELEEYSCAVGDIVIENRTWFGYIAFILSVFLTLGLIGVLFYRMKKCGLPKNHETVNGEAQYETVCINAAPSVHTQKEEDQDIHYSSIHFVDLKLNQRSTETTEKEDVQYAAVMFS